jgi:isovaleryl-CoA dehydrogenase
MQGKIADMYAKMNASRAYVYAVAAACDRGRVTRQDAAACLLFAAEASVEVANEAVQAFGGMGFMNETAVSRYYRDAKLGTIGGGTAEIRRMLIARELMRAIA